MHILLWFLSLCFIVRAILAIVLSRCIKIIQPQKMAQRYARDQPQGYENCIKRVTIIGGGGKIGRHFTEALIKTGKHIVTVIQRPQSTTEIPHGAVVVKLNYADDDSTDLVQALQGQQVLLITMSVLAPQDTLKKLIRAAAEAGVPYIFPNWFGQDPNNESLCQDTLLAPSRDAACQEITRLGVSAYLLLSCQFWYEFSLGGGPNRYGFDFINRSFVIFDDGDERINTTTWPQCGRAVAAVLSLKELPDDEDDQAVTLSQFANGAIYVSSFLLSQKDMFEVVKRVTKTTEADWRITHESSETRWRDSMVDVKKGDWSAFTKMLYSRVWFKNGGGDFETTKGLHNEVLNLPAEDLDAATAVAIEMGENGTVPFGH